jgi:GT2 family glycosyltransferase
MELLSVLIPVRNQVRYIERAIDSVLNQSYRDFVVLIMDDGSTDATPEILQHCAARDPRVKVFSRAPRGLPATRNELLKLAETPLVAWLDSDDVAMPERLALQVEAMTKDAHLWLLGTAMASIDAQDRVVKQLGITTGPDVGRRMIQGCKVAQTSCMMRREPVIALGGYRAVFNWSQDYDLFLRVSERGKIDNLEYVGVHYRNHGNSVTNKNLLTQNLLADLARANHHRRMASLPDPTDKLTQCPDLFEEPILDEMLGDQVRIYRAIYLAANDLGDPIETLEQLIHYRPSRRQKRQCQDAIVRLLKKRGFDWLSVRALRRAAELGPMKAARDFIGTRT